MNKNHSNVRAKLGNPTRLGELSKQEALVLSEKVQAGVQAIERSWWQLMRLVDLCLKRHVPRAMGLNASDWMKRYLEGSLSESFRKLRIFRSLASVPEEKIEAMKERNAYELCRLPQRERTSEEWLDKAVKMPVSEFKEQVDRRLEEKGIFRERFCDFFLRVPEGAYHAVFEEAEKKAARLLVIDLEHCPEKRLEVWEKIALFVLTTEDEHFLIETQGLPSETVGP